MSHYEFHQVACIGRFEPCHNGHLPLFAEALRRGERVLVILGSAFGARTPKNPFTWQERAAMIRAALAPEDAQRVRFVPVRDYYNDDRWVAAVRKAVNTLALGPKTAVVGHFKDNSSYYLNRFRGWELISCPNFQSIDATVLRDIYFDPYEPGLWGGVKKLARKVLPKAWRPRRRPEQQGNLALLSTRVPPAVLEALAAFRHLPEYDRLVDEWERIRASKDKWVGSPYEPTFTTVDALVCMQDKVLLIRRAGDVGEGLLAIPGGYLEPQETLLQSAVRELKEETNFGLYEPTLVDSLESVRVFDHPARSLRGRFVTHLHTFNLKDRAPVPVRGNGKEGEVMWVAKDQLCALEGECFEDHFHMLNDRLNLIDSEKEDVVWV